MNKRNKILAACMAVAIAGGSYWYWQYSSFINTPTAAPYDNLVDYRNEYGAAEEIKQATERLQAGVPSAKVIAGNPQDSKKEIAITFDGMADRGVMEGLLDVLKKYDYEAAFFVEGANAGAEPRLVAKIAGDGHILGNYSFVGLTRAERVPKEKLIEELCRTQRVLQVATDKKAELVKLHATRYLPVLLKSAKASGLDYAVESNVFVPVAKITDAKEAEAFVSSLKPGMVVSVQLGIPSGIVFETKKKEDTPAVDKMPTLKEGKEPSKTPPVVQVMQQVCAALKQQGYRVVPVTEFEKAAKTVAASATPAKPEPIGGLQAALINSVDAVLGTRTAYAAPAKGATAPRPAQDLSAGATDAYLADLREKNQGILAQDDRMLHTTMQAVPVTFTGFSKPAALDHVLSSLAAIKSKGTFFVSERELTRNKANIDKIAAAGQELGIAIYPKPTDSFNDICREILRVHNRLKASYGQNTTLVKQSSGVVQNLTKEAVAALGYRLVGTTINVVQTRHKDAEEPQQVLPDLFGKSVFSVGRGWIVNIRTDYYTNQNLAGDMLLYLKRKKIDNIAYNSYYDISGENKANDSAYRIMPVGQILANRDKLFTYPVPKDRYLPSLKKQNYMPDTSDKAIMATLDQRYIGATTVDEEDRMLGFSRDEIKRMDKSGLVKTNQPVVFFTFDDWGMDASINKLLYVFRKHKVKGTFFILTNNILNNPNLLRAIALEGHDIGSHTNLHKPMAITDPKTKKQVPSMTYEEFSKDMETSYDKLAQVVGDVEIDGKPAFQKLFRPPTLAVSKFGLQAVLENGYEYSVSGSTSTQDYSADSLEKMIKRVRDGLYFKKKVKDGAVFVMHMSDSAQYTALALDILLTANEKKAEDDPTKFKVGRLSDYLVEGYKQIDPSDTTVKHKRKIEWWN